MTAVDVLVLAGLVWLAVSLLVGAGAVVVALRWRRQEPPEERPFCRQPEGRRRIA